MAETLQRRTADIIDILRGMRAAIVDAADSDSSDEGLRRANELAQAVGRLVVAEYYREDTTPAGERVDGLTATLKNDYGAWPPMMRHNTDAYDRARYITDIFPKLLDEGIDEGELGGEFRLGMNINGPTFKPASLRYRNTHNPQIFAGLSTDLVQAHIMNEIVYRRLGRRFTIIPLALDAVSMELILPSDVTKIPRNPQIYLDLISSADTADMTSLGLQAYTTGKIKPIIL